MDASKEDSELQERHCRNCDFSDAITRYFNQLDFTSHHNNEHRWCRAWYGSMMHRGIRRRRIGREGGSTGSTVTVSVAVTICDCD
jgi:hypothetical protein